MHAQHKDDSPLQIRGNHKKKKKEEDRKRERRRAREGRRLSESTHSFERRAYQMPWIFTSLGVLAPRSVSEGCTDSKTPPTSLVFGS